jgi:4-hydroxy-3-methylbut-2-enyl diphosphate reductase
MKVLLARPRGFCAGVDRAIAIVERALLVYGAPIYVRHEIVHNRNVVKRLCQKGSIFVDELHEIPEGSVVVFSAHGAPKAVFEEAKRRNLKIFDATCPLVTKVHTEVEKLDADGYQIIMIGHEGHPEVEGTVGQVASKIDVIESPSQIEDLKIRNPDKVAYVSQTTISHDEAKIVIKALREKFPKIAEPKKEDICYATQNRQDAVKKLAKLSDLVLVVGSKSSSNSNRLREVAEGAGCRAYLLDDAGGLNVEWFKGVGTVGITAGASAPEDLVVEIVQTLRQWGGEDPEDLTGVEENVKFPLPKGLWKSDVEKALAMKQA